MGLLDTYRESNRASNRELDRNFPSPQPVKKSKEQVLAEAGVKIAPAARGISTLAGNNTTPFVPPITSGDLSIASPVENNAWIQTAVNAGQPLTPSVPRPPMDMTAANAQAAKSAPAAVPDITQSLPLPAGGGSGAMYAVNPDGSAAGKIHNAAGPAGGGFSAVSKPTVTPTYLSDDEFIAKQRNDDRLTLAQNQQQDAMRQLAAGVGIPNEYDRSFVGKADMSNPSFRNAMATTGAMQDKRASLAGLVAGGKGITDHADDMTTKKYVVDQGVEAQRLKSIADVESARLGADGRGRASIADLANDAAKQAAKKEADDQKQLVDGLNRMGLVADSRSIGAARDYYKQDAAWDAKASEINKRLSGPGRKGGPTDPVVGQLFQAYKPLVLKYHDTEDPAEKMAVKKELDGFIQKNRLANNSDFMFLLNRPQFNTKGLLTHKGNQQAITG